MATKPKILVARQVFPEVIERLRGDFEVDDNQADVILGVDGLKARLADKQGVMTAAPDPVTAEVLRVDRHEPALLRRHQAEAADAPDEEGGEHRRIVAFGQRHAGERERE